jgi:hypothetical protein
MNIRDNTVECGYCGNKIPSPSGKSPAAGGKAPVPGGTTVRKGGEQIQQPADEPGNEDEEGGGLSAYLQPGEQIRIGSLNVSVKKFFFHAYLTDKRIFLIDTQEKKLKVTAKDVALDTIAGSIVELSENSDPVLVLSIRSPDDEIKTMKLVFVQNGMDRSAEIDEWISLLQDKHPAGKPARKTSAEPAMPAEEPVSDRPFERPARKQELHPTKKPVKDHEKQPPVKRLLSLYKVPQAEPESGPGQEPKPEPEPEVVMTPRRTQVRQVAEPVRKVVATAYDREVPPVKDSEARPVRKPEVQSAMKVAMKGAAKPLQQQTPQPLKRSVVEPVRRQLQEAEPGYEPVSSRRPVVEETWQEKPAQEEGGDTPQFCHNCGKKLPHAANFCPGCGTKLNQGRTLPHPGHSVTTPEKRATRTDPPPHEHRPAREEESDEDEAEEERAVRPPARKAPKGSEMTILHKFLRR